MNWQRLKSNLAKPFIAVNDRVNRFVTYLSVPLNLFRFVALLLVIDFVAFMSLTRSSYAQMLNPLAFLSSGPAENRDTMELYFPRSLSLTGIEEMYPEDDSSAASGPAVGGHTANRKVEEKPLDDAAVPGEVILIKKRVARPQLKDAQGNAVDRGEAYARRVIQELIAGPSGELATLKARNLLKEPLFLRAAWSHQGILYLSTQKSVWDKMSPNERKVTEYCIVESLKKSIGNDKFVLLRE